ncbi:UDP-N-acetylenolpyruvoylglucosamine reductase [Orientia chuto str. Dubai]|uniref:UDP-N-acetylenolpyruvoylglucosamine reductase n=1 Tax=Orientia chuto str. Dubai TaxID=1359168 RepID=A0A0F3ML60_9RICK|nr:UDP-N-acetylmuramate dehydrogenase [Candidatus Orientia mediorientalis]KJV56523.1 UDP-N-acetylenolpyruvoylglucosamine reductase [Orientia chuto str. Dubai]
MLSLPKVNGEYRENFKLFPLTWFKVGGISKVFYKPKDEQDLSSFLVNLPPDIQVNILGAGSNMLVRDGGIDGVTIKLGRNFNDINLIKNNHYAIISVGAGTLNCNVAKFCLQYGLGGLEFLSGIPGTIGGGIAMNAGAYGQEFKDIVYSVEAFDRLGSKHIFLCKDLNFQYRRCNMNGFLIFTRANLICYNDSQISISKKLQRIKTARKLTQPINQKTAGSAFCNTSSYKAWQLIDQVGLRGYTIGDAQVSNLHCNFLINNGNATASDIENLGELIRKKVFDCTGIELEWEIRIVGNKSP